MQKELVKALERYPVFNAGDIAGVLGKDKKYAYIVAHRLKKAGVIKEIEKGKYTMENDPFIVGSWIVWPSYISGWAALNYHKLTEQLPFTIHIVTTRKRKRKVIRFGNARIEFIMLKKEAFCGFQRVIYQGREIFIAEKEKAIVDALMAKKMSLSEATELIKSNPGKINRKKVFYYAGKSKRLIKQLRGAMDN